VKIKNKIGRNCIAWQKRKTGGSMTERKICFIPLLTHWYIGRGKENRIDFLKNHVIFYMGFMSSNYRNTVMKDLPLVATNHYKPRKRTRITRDTSSIPMIFSPKMFPSASCVRNY
jgi:hypothetical protein